MNPKAKRRIGIYQNSICNYLGNVFVDNLKPHATVYEQTTGNRKGGVFQMTHKVFSFRAVAVALALVLVLAPGLFAGGGQEAADEQITIRIGEHPGAHVGPMEEHFIPLYEEMTGINIEMEVLPPDQVWQRFQLDAPDGVWDIGYHSPGWFGYFYEYVADLTPHMERFDFDPYEHYPEPVINSHMTNELLRPGEIIAFARNPMSPIMAYRQDWFEHPDEQAAFQEEYGRALTVPETWDELYEVAVFFTRPAGSTVAGETLDRDLYGYSASVSEPGGMARAFLAVVYSMGLDGFDENFQTDLDDPLLLEGVEFWTRLIRDTFPEDALTWNFLEHVDFFAEGRLAMSELWPEAVLTAESRNAAGNVGYSTLPVWPDNRKDLPIGRSFLGGGGVLVFDTPNQEHAYDFLHWLLVENAVEFTLRTAMFALEEQFESEEVLSSQPFYDDFLPVFLAQMEYAFPRQPIAEWGEVMYTPVGQFASDVFYGVESPEAAQQRLVDNTLSVFRREGYID